MNTSQLSAQDLCCVMNFAENAITREESNGRGIKFQQMRRLVRGERCN